MPSNASWLSKIGLWRGKKTNLDAPLITLSPDGDAWTLRDATQGLQVFGGTGSGKTTGSGQCVAKAFLDMGLGGLVLTAKVDERALWERYARATGRTNDLRIITPGGPYRLNLLDYEYQGCGGRTEPLVHLLSEVLSVTEGGDGQGKSRGDDGSYWQQTTQQLLRNAIDLQSIAEGTVSLPNLYQIVLSAPQDAQQVHNTDWQTSSYLMQLLTTAEARAANIGREHDLEMTATFWLREWPSLAEKTRSIVQSSFTSLVDGFLRGDLYELFCTDTTITPEDSHAGAIILLDLPIKQYHALSKMAQVLFKSIWQRSAERRQITDRSPCIFLWADEAHYFTTLYDAIFQTTARGSRVSTVYLTQSIDNYRMALGGGDTGQAATDALLANLSTKIFHANTGNTNTWAADLIAKSWQVQTHGGISTPQQGVFDHGALPASSISASTTQVYEYDIPPQTFLTLATGGPAYSFQTEALVFQSGRVFAATGAPYLLTTFSQKD